MKKNWQTKKLNDICEVEYGTRVVRKKDGGTIYPVYGGGGATFLLDSYNREDCLVISRFAMSEQCTRFVSGKFFLNDSGLTVSSLNVKELTQDFLNAQMFALNDHIYSLARGTAQKNLDVPAFRAMQISYPESIAEQHRIVKILDEVFAAAAKVKEITIKNLVNAQELVKSNLNSIFSQHKQGWKKKILGEVCQFENGDRGKNYPHRSEYVASGIPWINTGHILRNGRLSQSEMNFITREKFNTLRSGKIEKGDLVYCLRGATLGKTALVEPFVEGAIASSLVILRPSKFLDSHFLYFFLTSQVGQELIRGYQNGAAQPNLGAKSVAKYPILLPPINEQREIVEKIASLSFQTLEIENIYSKKLRNLEELKKSVLKKAFSGEL